MQIRAVHPHHVGTPDMRYVPLGSALVLAHTRRNYDVMLLDLLNNSPGRRDIDRTLAICNHDVSAVLRPLQWRGRYMQPGHPLSPAAAETNGAAP